MSFSLGTMVALCSSCAMLDDRLEPQTTDEVLKQVQTKERLELESAVRRRLSHISGLLDPVRHPDRAAAAADAP